MTTSAPELSPETSTAGDRPPRRLPDWAISAVPAGLMLLIGAIRITGPGLGWDENATWLASRRFPGQIVELAGNFDGVISPYYLLMHFWTLVFGDSELALRLPSLLAVAAGIGVSAELGRRLLGPDVGLLAGLFLTLVPQLSRYAQDARAYGFAFLFATLSTLLLYQALQRDTWRRWITYAVVITLLGLAHILGLLVLLGHAAIVLSRRGPVRWLIVTAIAVLPVLPFVYLGLTQRSDQLDWIAPMTWRQVSQAPGAIFGSAAVGLLLTGLALAVRRPGRQVFRELAVLAVAPPAVLLAVSFVTSSLWVPRYVLVVVPAISLVAAAALRGLKWQAAAVLVLLIGVGGPAQVAVRNQNSHMGPDFTLVSTAIRENRQPGDVIVYGRTGTWSLRAGIDYQLRHEAKPKDALLQIPAAEVGELNAVECPDKPACLTGAPRIWFFRGVFDGDPILETGPLTDAGSMRKMLTTDYRRAQTWEVPKGNLILFIRR